MFLLDTQLDNYKAPDGRQSNRHRRLKRGGRAIMMTLGLMFTQLWIISLWHVSFSPSSCFLADESKNGSTANREMLLLQI